MKKMLFGLLGTMVVIGANAAIVDRTDCNATQTEINTLKVIEEPSDEIINELAELEKIYRRDCTKRATGRRSSGHVIKQEVTVPTENVTTDEQEIEVLLDDDVAPVQQEVAEVAETEPVVAAPAEPTAEEVEANEQAGLCPNGDAPNKFGCCAGEKFTDLGNTVFACCPDEGGDCFPPLVK